MRLYDIAADYRRLQDMLDAADTPEEMRQTLIDTLESLSGDFEDKVENMAALIAEYKATIEGCRTEIARLTGKAARAENAIDSIKKYIMAEMQFAGIKKVNAGTWNITIAKNGGKAPIVWDDDIEPEDLPEKYRSISYKIDTAAVRDALEAGEALDFAKLGERGESLRIK